MTLDDDSWGDLESEVERESLNLYAMFMEDVRIRLRKLPIEDVRAYGMKAFSTDDPVGTLREFAEWGPECSRIICTAVAATLLTEIRARVDRKLL